MTKKRFLGGRPLKNSSRLTRRWRVRVFGRFDANYDADDNEGFPQNDKQFFQL